MLTKELIRCRLDGGQLRPRFVDPDHEVLQHDAARLLAVYRASPAPTRGEIEDAAAGIAATSPDPVLCRGLDKLLADRCEFGTPAAMDYEARRVAVFRAAGAVLRGGPPADLAAYRAAVMAAAALPTGPEDDLYADLPENERLRHFRDLGPRQLLERYNVALVQALLLRSTHLEAVIGTAEPSRLRRLLKYLRFFRLLARLTPVTAAPEPPTWRLHVDGPASILAETRRYGLQLASFFPALCALETWSLETEVEWQGRPRRLRLDQGAGLVSHYRHFSAYVPEDIRLFHRHFRETVRDWQVTGETPFLRGSGQEMIFPDLSFRHGDGTVLHLELFHRWHAGPLLERLQWLSRRPEEPLILGVDQVLARDEAVAAALEQAACFQQRGFLFRDYPTVAKTLKALERTRGGLGPGARG
ncbi:MAG: DUF790 family protein [Lentisphaerae bacterium]|nr:DUF790 family protein [Lentisphaerota bacterium]